MSKNTTKDMAKHSGLLGLAAYAVMRLSGQKHKKAMKHSVALSGAAFAYMGAFGHGPPNKLRGPFFPKKIEGPAPEDDDA